MAEMSREEFNRLKEESSKRIRDMYKGHSMPPYPDFISLQKQEKSVPQKEESVNSPQKNYHEHHHSNNNWLHGLLRSINLSELLKNPESLLILGLIILLISDKADEKLVLALVFIML